MTGWSQCIGIATAADGSATARWTWNWLDSQTSQFAAPPITHELMIWLEAYGSMGPAGAVTETVTIGGADYDVHVADNFGRGWRYIAYRRKVAQLGATTLDIKAILDHARARALITGAEFVSSIELGNEVISGAGETTVSGFVATIR